MPAASDLRSLRVDGARLMRRLAALGEIGPIEGGGNNRLALTDADKEGRDLVVTWMHDLGLAVGIDEIGNVVGTRAGRKSGPPVMTGSHIDTVRTGGRYDGNLGVLAGLEVVEVLEAAGITTRRPLAVGFFTNEEGSRFQPDMAQGLGAVDAYRIPNIPTSVHDIHRWTHAFTLSRNDFCCAVKSLSSSPLSAVLRSLLLALLDNRCFAHPAAHCAAPTPPSPSTARR